MPAYDFKCDGCNGVFEFFLKHSQLDTAEFKCEVCDNNLTYSPSFYYTSRAAQAFDPVVIHKDAQGNVRLPGHSNAPVPEGFQRIELRTSREVHAFEREMNTKDQAVANDFHAKNEAYRQGQIAHNRGEMKEFINGRVWTDSNGEVRHGLSPRGRKFYEAMREQSDRKKHSAKNPEFVVEAFSYNASNRPEYHSGGRFERGRK